MIVVLLLSLSLIVIGQHDLVVPFQMEVNRQLQEGGSCLGMSTGSIMLTATTTSTFEFTEFQRHGIRLMMASEDNKCLLSKLITICLDAGCEKLCREKRVSHCTRYSPTTSRGEGSPDYNSGSHGEESWRALTHLKWEFIATCFKMGATSVLWMDADMLLLKNPYLDLAGKVTNNASVLHLTNTNSATGVDGCDAPAHTGFMLLGLTGRNFKYRVIQMAEHMLEANHKAEIMNGSRLEQEVLEDVIKEVGVSRCGLNKMHYTGACHHAHDDGVKVEDVVTYHANCGKGELSREQQVSLIRHMLGHKAQPDKHDPKDVNPFDP